MAYKPNYFPNFDPIQYTSWRERLGVAVAVAAVAAGRTGLFLKRLLRGTGIKV